MQWVGASQQLPTLSWNLPLTCYLHLRNCFLSLACLRCSLTNLSSSQCQLSKSKRKARRLYQHHQDVSSYSSYFMARDFRRKMLFSSAAKPSPIPTPCSQCPCRPSPVSLSQLSSLISWTVSIAKKHLCLCGHSSNHRNVQVGKDLFQIIKSNHPKTILILKN